jgi:hypothetical protein
MKGKLFTPDYQPPGFRKHREDDPMRPSQKVSHAVNAKRRKQRRKAYAKTQQTQQRRGPG